MLTGMVALSIEGLSADIEKNWLAQMAPPAKSIDAIGEGRKLAGKMRDVSGVYGLSAQAEQQWLSLIGARG